MGGPTKKELHSNEFISRWLDDELSSLERRLFQRELEKSSSEDVNSLKTRVEQQSSAQKLLLELFSSKNFKPTPKVENEIEKLVNEGLNFRSETTEGPEFDDIDITQDEYLISQYVDGELDDNEITERNINEIIKSSSKNRDLYQNLIRTKFAAEELFKTDGLKVSDNVARQIDNLVASNLLGQKMASEAPPASSEVMNSMRADTRLMVENFDEPTDKSFAEYMAEKKINKKRFSFGNFSMPSIPQIASLAAVFVVGIVVSPDIYQRITPQNNNEEIILRSGDNSLGSETIEIKQNIAVTESVNPKKLIVLDYPFTLQFLPPINGDVTIHLNAKNETLKNKIEKGEKFDLGYFEKADVITFPKSGAMEVDQTDKLLRVDFIIENENEIIEMTRWFEIINKDE